LRDAKSTVGVDESNVSGDWGFSSLLWLVCDVDTLMPLFIWTISAISVSAWGRATYFSSEPLGKVKSILF
jgi:hypothetical protein